MLPAAGTLLAIGRILTSKALVVKFVLIASARARWPGGFTPEAVDASPRVSDRAVILRYFGVRSHAQDHQAQRGVLKEHLELIYNHLLM